MFQFTRRQFLAQTSAGVATLALVPTFGCQAAVEKKAEEEKPVGYTLPKLPYAYDALEPSIDAKTMEIHYTKHHQAYINNANNALKDYPKLLAKPVDDLLRNISEVPDKIKKAVVNNAGGHSNHSIFWEIMGPKGGEPGGALAKAIDKAFDSFDKFQKTFSTAGTTQFGSGWAWLVVGKKGLEIVQRANQDSPLMDGLEPLLGIDVWEHAYYLKYQNRRPDYIAAWWKVVNWKAVEDRYGKASKS